MVLVMRWMDERFSHEQARQNATANECASRGSKLPPRDGNHAYMPFVSRTHLLCVGQKHAMSATAAEAVNWMFVPFTV